VIGGRLSPFVPVSLGERACRRQQCLILKGSAALSLFGEHCVIFTIMATNQLRSVKRVTLKREILDSTLKTIREFGRHRSEALLLWLGHVEAETAQIVKVFTPEQHAISSEDGVGYFVDGNTLFQLNRDLSETGLRLIAQVHSHPQEAYHSAADDRYAIVTAEGGLSLVVPYFGRAPADPTSWAVYRLRGHRWEELKKNEAKMLFELVENQ
jgi:Prokaryotic homologs of the JAB domain